MCTATLHWTPGKFLLTMNRDEARTRGAELPPMEHRTPEGTAWLAPADSDQGGTWMAINAHGLAACLLNRYQDRLTHAPDHAESRGRIIPRLMETSSVDAARQRLLSGAIELVRYPPFSVVLAGPEGALRLDWRGSGPLAQTAFSDGWSLFSSSFFDPEIVLPWRQRAFEAWLGEGAPVERGIPAIHLHCPPGMESVAPMMSRDISCTRSITQASFGVGQGRARLRYTPIIAGAPDWTAFDHALTLISPTPAR